jgi:DNA-binding XRE family transcriptional regulator
MSYGTKTPKVLCLFPDPRGRGFLFLGFYKYFIFLLTFLYLTPVQPSPTILVLVFAPRILYRSYISMPKQHPKNLNNLWIARQKAGLRQKSVARLLGYKSISPISEYETGTVLPSLSTAFKLALIYNTPLSELYDSLYRRSVDEIATVHSKMPTRISAENQYNKPL